MQRYLKVEKLNQQINETKQRVHDTKEEYHKIAVSVKENSEWMNQQLVLNSTFF